MTCDIGEPGHVETRTAVVSTHIDWIQAQHQWPGLQAIAKVTRIREAAEKTSSVCTTIAWLEVYGISLESIWAEHFNCAWMLRAV